MTETPFDLAGVLAQIHERTAIRHRVCIDPDLRDAIDEAQGQLDRAESDYAQAMKRAEAAAEDAYMSDTPAVPDTAAVDAAKAALEDAKKAANGAEVTVVFKPYLGKKYDKLVREYAKVADKAETDDRVTFLDQWTKYAGAAFQRVEDPNGNPIDFTWDQVCEHLLTGGDRARLGQQVIAANERPTSIPT